MSGGVKVVATYAEHLQRRGHAVTVLTPLPHRPSLRDRARALVRERRWIGRKGSHLDSRRLDHRVLPHHGPVTDEDVPDADVVVATWWETANWVARLAPRKGAKVIFIQGYEALGEGSPEIDATWRLPFQKIVVSRWLEELARARFGDSHVIRVPNAVDFSQFDAAPRGKQRRPTLGMLSHRSVLKGTGLALEAVRRIREMIPDLRVVSFGSEPPDRHLTLPPGFEFHLLPHQDQIRNLYSVCDVWLCSSHREGFHLPPLEAMACRCPVVSTRVGGPDDLVRPGENGYLVEVGDVTGLADAAGQVLLAPDGRWREMSDAAYSSARQYGIEEAAGAYERALQTAIGRASRGEVEGGHRVTAGLR